MVLIDNKLIKSDQQMWYWFCVSFRAKRTSKTRKTPTRLPTISAKISCRPLTRSAWAWPWTTPSSSTRSPIYPRKLARWPKMYSCPHTQLIFISFFLLLMFFNGFCFFWLWHWLLDVLLFPFPDLSQSFDDAMKDIDTSSAEQFKDSALILQLLRDNLTVSVWPLARPPTPSPTPPVPHSYQ